MNWIDWVIIAVVALATFGGMVQGFFRSFFGLGGLVCGFLAAVWNYARLGKIFFPVVQSESIADAIAFLTIVVLATLVGAVVGGILQKAFRWAGLGCLDTVLGAVLGLLQGVAAVIVFVLMTVAFFPGTVWLNQAKLPAMLFQACHISMDTGPKALSDQVEQSLKKLKRESPSWMHPSHPSQ